MKTKIFTLTLSILTCLLSYTNAQNSGDLDSGFGDNGVILDPIEGHTIEVFQDVAIQNDQKIVVVGNGWDDTYTARIYVNRYLVDGSLDPNFGTDGRFVYEYDNEALVFSCAITHGGKIILAGSTTDYTNNRVLLVQLNPNGTLDNSFGDNGVVIQQFSTVDQDYQDFARGVALDLNGNILIAGSSYDTVDGEVLMRPIVARFSSTGTLDTSFGEDGIASIPVVLSGNEFRSIEIQPDGKILAAGTYSPTYFRNVMLLVRFNEDGTLDDEFGQGGIIYYTIDTTDDRVFSMALTPEENILIGGFSLSTTNGYIGVLAQFTPDGVIDATFGTNGNVLEDTNPYNEETDIQVQADGKIIVGGTSGSMPPGDFNMAVWKYNPDGSRDTDFGINGLVQHTIEGYKSMMHGVALQADNKIVVAGQARTDNNENAFLVMRLENGEAVISTVNEINYDNAPKLSPNPALASSEIRIQLSGAASANDILEICSITGKLLFSTSIGNALLENQNLTTTLPSNITNGIYLVRISQNGIFGGATKLVVIK